MFKSLLDEPRLVGYTEASLGRQQQSYTASNLILLHLPQNKLYIHSGSVN